MSDYCKKLNLSPKLIPNIDFSQWDTEGLSWVQFHKILEHKENIKGEFVAVIEKQTSKNQDFDNINLYSNELKKMATKFSLTDIVEIVHKFTKINKNKIYKWLLKLRK